MFILITSHLMVICCTAVKCNLYKKNIVKIFGKICSLNSKERLKLIGLREGRENLIIPGTLIILYLLGRYNKDKIVVSDGGLLEGIIYSEADKFFNNII